MLGFGALGQFALGQAYAQDPFTIYLGGAGGWPYEIGERKEPKWKPAYPHLREEIEATFRRARGLVDAAPETPAAKAVAPFLDAPIDWDALLTTARDLQRLELALMAYAQALAEEEEDDDFLLLVS